MGAIAKYIPLVMGWIKNNWKIVVVVCGIIYFTGIWKNVVTRWKVNQTVKSYKDDPAVIDYRYLAMQLNDAFDKALWFIDREAITSLVNSLNSQGEFLNLVRVYALEYNKDLRALLRDRFTDKKYALLRWK